MKIQLWLTLGVTACLTFFPLAAQAEVTFESMLKENGGDVDRNHWATEAIQNVVDKYHIMSGFPDKKFKGDKSTTRYEIAAALYEVMKYMDKYVAEEVSRREISPRPYSQSDIMSENDLSLLSVMLQQKSDPLKFAYDKLATSYVKFATMDDVKIMTALQTLFNKELDQIKAEKRLIKKADTLSRVKVYGTVEVRYRDRVSVSDNP